MTQSSSLHWFADTRDGTHSLAASKSGYGGNTSISTILLISFNMASAALLMVTVLFNLTNISKKNNSLQRKMRHDFLRSIQPGEIVTLSFTVAVIIQGLILLIVQSLKTNSSISLDCAESGKIFFPVMWIVGLVILVFGVETLYRGFKKIRFAPRGKGSVYACWAAIVVLTLLLYIPVLIQPPNLNNCSYSFLSIATPWSDVAFGITVSLLFLYILIASILAIQLYRATDVDPKERIAASQIVYYLGIATAIFAFSLPLWISFTFSTPEDVTPMMAMVSINISGIIVSFFQMLFWHYTDYMVIRNPSSRYLGKWKTSRSWSTGIKDKISAPIAIPQEEHTFDSIYKEIDIPMSVPKEVYINKSLPPTPAIPKKLTIEPPRGTTPHYSVFPVNPSSTRQPKYPTPSIYETDDTFLAPPLPPFAAHVRNSSDLSHQTVQIGFRFSDLDSSSGSSTTESEQTTSIQNNPSSLSQYLENPNTANHLSATSLDVPVTLRSSTTTTLRPTGVDAFPPKIPSKLRSTIRMPLSSPSSSSDFYFPSNPDTTSTASTRGSSINQDVQSTEVYQKLDDLQRLLEEDMETAQRGLSGSSIHNNESWPLRDSLPSILPQKTYRPGDN